MKMKCLLCIVIQVINYKYNPIVIPFADEFDIENKFMNKHLRVSMIHEADENESINEVDENIIEEDKEDYSLFNFLKVKKS